MPSEFLVFSLGNGCEPAVNQPLRSFTLRTNFRPDHTSDTAHTFTSTSPASSPIRRTSFSFMSVATPDVFFGQEIHNMPDGARRFASRTNSLFNSVCVLANTIAK